MDTFTIRDLRERTGELVRGAEAGELALVTKHGRPVFVALPIDDTLLEAGVHRSLALRLHEAGVVSFGKAARIADLPPEAFLELMAQAGLVVAEVEEPDKELERELAVLD